MRLCIIYLLLLLAPAFTIAQDVAAGAKADLNQALSELRSQREAIAEEKSALLNEFNELEAQVRQQRRDWDLLKITAGAQGARYEERRQRLEKLEQQYGALQSALDQYRIELQSNLPAPELNGFQAKFGETTEDFNARQTLELLTFGLERLEAAVGGRVIPGEAINPEGELITGKFFYWGPMAYFQSDWSGQAGFSTEDAGLAPRLSVFGTSSESAELAKAIEGQPARLPVDPSDGRALRLTLEQESLSEHIRSGGVWVWPILGLAAIALLVLAYKSGQIACVRLPHEQALESALNDLRAGKIDGVRQQISGWNEPARSLIQEALDRIEQPREVLEDLLLEHVIRWQMRWERGLAVLAVTAGVSPLLGLLGTVTGMIATFRLIGVYGSGDARPLSGGISEALVTTELGLMVAIPALIAHAMLSRKTQSLTSDLEGIATRFIDAITPGKEAGRE